ncbi:MAG: hypothetical protein KDB00_13740 [Planctomycetales bacterium]|nr:hypothetical protein [Planctomycetales bacterium]
MITSLLIVLALIGIGLIIVLIDCAKSLRESCACGRDTNEILNRELPRQTLILEAGVSDRRVHGNAAFRLEHTRAGTSPVGFRFDGNMRSRSVAGYCVWVFRDNGWQVEENHCESGFEPGPPPNFAGQFSGDRVRKEGIVKR